MLSISVADPLPFDADPYADPGPAFRFDADAAPDPIFQFGVDPDQDLTTHFSTKICTLPSDAPKITL